MAYSRIRFEIQNSATMTLVHKFLRTTESTIHKTGENQSASNPFRRRKERYVTTRSKTSQRLHSTSPRSIYSGKNVPRVIYEDRYGNIDRSRIHQKKVPCLYSDRTFFAPLRTGSKPVPASR